MVLVSGNSGTGKTSLVNQTKNFPDVYFVAGKFAVNNRNLPYTALIEAIDSLIQQVSGSSTLSW
jgi:predicted ATPase